MRSHATAPQPHVQPLLTAGARLARRFAGWSAQLAHSQALRLRILLVHWISVLCWLPAGWLLRSVLAICWRLPPARSGLADRPLGPAPEADAYQVYARSGNRPYVALHGQGQRALEAIGGISSFSVKRRVFVAQIGASTVLGHSMLLGRRGSPDPLLEWCGTDLRSICSALDTADRPPGSQIGPRSFTPSMIRSIEWSMDPRRPRAYLVFYDDETEEQWFVKLRPRRVDDHFIRERHALLHLGGTFHGYTVPRLIVSGTVGSVEFVATTAIPPPMRGSKVFPRALRTALLSSIEGVPIAPFSTIERQAWWHRWSGQAPRHRVSEVADLLNAGCRVGFVHGDLCPPNIVASPVGSWIVDWETACDAGPAWVDLLVIEWYFGGRIIRSPQASRAVVRYGATVAEVVASAVFLASNGHALARDAVTRRWRF